METSQYVLYQSSDTALFLGCRFSTAFLHALCVLSHISTAKDLEHFKLGEEQNSRALTVTPILFCYIS